MRAGVVGLWGAASCEKLLGKHIREMLRLRRLAGPRTHAVCRKVATTQAWLSMTTLLGRLRTVVVGLWGAVSHDGLRMTMLLEAWCHL